MKRVFSLFSKENKISKNAFMTIAKVFILLLSFIFIGHVNTDKTEAAVLNYVSAMGFTKTNDKTSNGQTLEFSTISNSSADKYIKLSTDFAGTTTEWVQVPNLLEQTSVSGVGADVTLYLTFDSTISSAYVTGVSSGYIDIYVPMSAAAALSTIELKVRGDGVLNIEATYTITFKIKDASAPNSPTITCANCGSSWKTTNVTASASGSSDYWSGLSHYQYSTNASSWTNGSSVTISADIDGYIYFRACDNAGNCSAATSKQVRIDKTAPVVSIYTEQDISGYYNSSRTSWYFGVSVQDSMGFSSASPLGTLNTTVYVGSTNINNYVTVAVDWSDNGSGFYKYTVKGISGLYGTVKITVNAGVAVSNSSLSSAATTLTLSTYVDQVAPSGSFSLKGSSALESGYTNTSSANVTMSVSDTGSGIKNYYMVTNKTGSDYTVYATSTTRPSSVTLSSSLTSNGNWTYDIRLQVTDNAGNTGYLSTPLHYIPNTQVTNLSMYGRGAAALANGYTRDTKFNLYWSATNAYKYKVVHMYNTSTLVSLTTDTSREVNTTSVGITPTHTTTHTLRLYAYDKAGNYVTKDSNVYYDNTAPTISSFYLKGQEAYEWGYTNKAYILISQSSSDASGIYKYEVYKDDPSTGTQYINLGSIPSNYGFTGASSSATYYLIVTDGAGNRSLAKSEYVSFDTTAPTFSSFSLKGTAAKEAGYSNSDVLLVTYSAESSYRYCISTGDKCTGTKFRDLNSAPISGTYTFVGYTSSASYFMTIYDVAGNATSKSAYVVYDAVAPLAPTGLTCALCGSWTNQDVWLEVSGATDATSGIAGYEFSYDKTSWSTAWTGTNAYNGSTGAGARWTQQRDGTVYFRAYDKAGNVSIVSAKSASIKIDKTAPEVNAVLTSSDDNSCLSQLSPCESITNISYASSDNLSGLTGYVYIYMSSSSTQLKPITGLYSGAQCTLTDGELTYACSNGEATNNTISSYTGVIYIFLSTIKDRAGNVSSSGGTSIVSGSRTYVLKLTLWMDNTAPTLTVTPTQNGRVYNKTFYALPGVNVDIEAYDSVSLYPYNSQASYYRYNWCRDLNSNINCTYDPNSNYRSYTIWLDKTATINSVKGHVVTPTSPGTWYLFIEGDITDYAEHRMTNPNLYSSQDVPYIFKFVIDDTAPTIGINITDDTPVYLKAEDTYTITIWAKEDCGLYTGTSILEGLYIYIGDTSLSASQYYVEGAYRDLWGDYYNIELEIADSLSGEITIEVTSSAQWNLAGSYNDDVYINTGIFVDTGAPTLTTAAVRGYQSKVNGYANTSVLKFTVSATDDYIGLHDSPYWVSICDEVKGVCTGGAYYTASQMLNANMATTQNASFVNNRTYKVYLRVRDKAGNITQAITLSLIYDNSAPIINKYCIKGVEANECWYTNGKTGNIDVKATDTNGIYSYTITSKYSDAVTVSTYAETVTYTNKGYSCLQQGFELYYCVKTMKLPTPIYDSTTAPSATTVYEIADSNLLPSREYTLNVVDNAGNSYSLTNDMYWDLVDPTISVGLMLEGNSGEVPGSGFTKDLIVDYAFEANDDNWYGHRLTGETTYKGAKNAFGTDYTLSDPLENEPTTVTLYACDKAGNCSESQAQITYVTNAPEITQFSLDGVGTKSHEYATDTVFFNLEATSSPAYFYSLTVGVGTTYIYSVGGDGGNSLSYGDYRLSVASIKDGSYQYCVSLINAAALETIVCNADNLIIDNTAPDIKDFKVTNGTIGSAGGSTNRYVVGDYLSIGFKYNEANYYSYSLVVIDYEYQTYMPSSIMKSTSSLTTISGDVNISGVLVNFDKLLTIRLTITDACNHSVSKTAYFYRIDTSRDIVIRDFSVKGSNANETNYIGSKATTGGYLAPYYTLENATYIDKKRMFFGVGTSTHIEQGENFVYCSDIGRCSDDVTSIFTSGTLMKIDNGYQFDKSTTADDWYNSMREGSGGANLALWNIYGRQVSVETSVIFDFSNPGVEEFYMTPLHKADEDRYAYYSTNTLELTARALVSGETGNVYYSIFQHPEDPIWESQDEFYVLHTCFIDRNNTGPGSAECNRLKSLYGTQIYSTASSNGTYYVFQESRYMPTVSLLYRSTTLNTMVTAHSISDGSFFNFTLHVSDAAGNGTSISESDYFTPLLYDTSAPVFTDFSLDGDNYGDDGTLYTKESIWLRTEAFDRYSDIYDKPYVYHPTTGGRILTDSGFEAFYILDTTATRWNNFVNNILNDSHLPEHEKQHYLEMYIDDCYIYNSAVTVEDFMDLNGIYGERYIVAIAFDRAGNISYQTGDIILDYIAPNVDIQASATDERRLNIRLDDDYISTTEIGKKFMYAVYENDNMPVNDIEWIQSGTSNSAKLSYGTYTVYIAVEEVFDYAGNSIVDGRDVYGTITIGKTNYVVFKVSVDTTQKSNENSEDTSLDETIVNTIIHKVPASICSVSGTTDFVFTCGTKVITSSGNKVVIDKVTYNIVFIYGQMFLEYDKTRVPVIDGIVSISNVMYERMYILHGMLVVTCSKSTDCTWNKISSEIKENAENLYEIRKVKDIPETITESRVFESSLLFTDNADINDILSLMIVYNAPEVNSASGNTSTVLTQGDDIGNYAVSFKGEESYTVDTLITLDGVKVNKIDNTKVGTYVVRTTAKDSQGRFTTVTNTIIIEAKESEDEVVSDSIADETIENNDLNENEETLEVLNNVCRVDANPLNTIIGITEDKSKKTRKN